MQLEISPENAAFLQSQVAAGRFQSPDAALEAAIALLKRRVELREHVLKGCDQLDRGEYIELDDEGLEKFFNELFNIAGV
ncbi:hypothetical protein [Lacipirellula parvula]|uniref:ParD protein n=1 Tax=Lacipirellula parvula TaxID=2650471 RepID=A0A5K7XBI8_9BACT|nr:hypothetical protein [Lacipirellula parvula]BBO31716.1 hypothetical protein PLANPX_1328 [Lacipirellula parvula]